MGTVSDLGGTLWYEAGSYGFLSLCPFLPLPCPAPCECSTTPPGQLSLCRPSPLSISPSAEGRVEELEAPWTGHRLGLARVQW